MSRIALLVFLLFAGCGRPVAAVLTYAPSPTADKTGPLRPADAQRAVAVVQERLRGGSLKCWVSLDDARNVRVEAFTDDQAALDRIDRIVRAAGTLEFRIVANELDHARLIELAEETKGREVYDTQGSLLGWWVPIVEGKEDELLPSSPLVKRTIETDSGVQAELLVVNDPYQINEGFLQRVRPGVDEHGRPTVRFSFSDKGGEMMAGLTTENLSSPSGQNVRQLAILFNGRVYSAPGICATIRQQGEITGDFSLEEVHDLVAILNSGTLRVSLEQVSVEHLNQGK